MTRHTAPAAAAAPAAERTGSKRTEQLVEIAREKLGTSLPPVLHVRRYAALLAAAESYTAFEDAAAGSVYIAAHAAEGTQYGIDGHSDPATARAAHHNAIKLLSQFKEKAAKAKRSIADVSKFYHDHQHELPSALEYPEAQLAECFRVLRNFERYLAATTKSGPRLPEAPRPKGATSKGFTVARLCLLWWAVGTLYRGRWSHMSALALAWDLREPEYQKSGRQDAELFERQVRRLLKQHPTAELPSPAVFLRSEDRDLF